MLLEQLLGLENRLADPAAVMLHPNPSGVGELAVMTQSGEKESAPTDRHSPRQPSCRSAERVRIGQNVNQKSPALGAVSHLDEAAEGKLILASLPPLPLWWPTGFPQFCQVINTSPSRLGFGLSNSQAKA